MFEVKAGTHGELWGRHSWWTPSRAAEGLRHGIDVSVTDLPYQASFEVVVMTIRQHDKPAPTRDASTRARGMRASGVSHRCRSRAGWVAAFVHAERGIPTGGSILHVIEVDLLYYPNEPEH
jgi:hypothetical protein